MNSNVEFKLVDRSKVKDLGLYSCYRIHKLFMMILVNPFCLISSSTKPLSIIFFTLKLVKQAQH